MPSDKKPGSFCDAAGDGEACERGDDVGVVELALGFFEEALLEFVVGGELGQEELEREAAFVEVEMARFPDFRHAAFADVTDEGVLAYVVTGSHEITLTVIARFVRQTAHDLSKKLSFAVGA
jgi:hypothetical protein